MSADQRGSPSLLTPIQAFRWFIEYGGRHGTNWRNEVTRVLPPTPCPFHAGIAAPRLDHPLFMMIAPEDEMPGADPEVSRAAYASVRGPKELVETGGGHFGLLHHPSELFFRKVASMATTPRAGVHRAEEVPREDTALSG